MDALARPLAVHVPNVRRTAANVVRRAKGDHVNNRLQRSMRWALGVGGVLGLLCALSLVPVALNFFARGGAIVAFWASMPTWLQWAAVPPNGFEMIVVGALCALLLVSGRWPAAACALVAAAWSLYADVTFSPGGHWAQQIQLTFVMTPYRVAALVSLAVLLLISVLALAMAARAGGSASMHGETAERAG